MYGITITSKKNKATAKILSHLCSFLFEQEFDELRGWPESDKKILRQAKEILAKHV